MNQPIFILTAILLAGCSSPSGTTTNPNDKARARNEGYTLLYSLADKAGDADKLFIIKDARPQVVAEIKQIAQIYKDAKLQLDEFKRSDSRLDFTVSDLPKIEVETRDAIGKTYTKKLLFSGGKNFEVEFLQSQIRSLDYAAHLAKMIVANEDSKTRIKYLTKFATQCDQHHKIIIELLANL